MAGNLNLVNCVPYLAGSHPTVEEASWRLSPRVDRRGDWCWGEVSACQVGTGFKNGLELHLQGDHYRDMCSYWAPSVSMQAAFIIPFPWLYIMAKNNTVWPK